MSEVYRTIATCTGIRLQQHRHSIESLAPASPEVKSALRLAVSSNVTGSLYNEIECSFRGKLGQEYLIVVFERTDEDAWNNSKLEEQIRNVRFRD